MNRDSMRPGTGGDQCFMFCSVLLVAHKKDRPVKTCVSHSQSFCRSSVAGRKLWGTM